MSARPPEHQQNTALPTALHTTESRAAVAPKAFKTETNGNSIVAGHAGHDTPFQSMSSAATDASEAKRTSPKHKPYAKCETGTQAKRDKCIVNISKNWTSDQKKWLPVKLLDVAPSRNGQNLKPCDWSTTFLEALESLSYKTRGEHKEAKCALVFAYNGRRELEPSCNPKLLDGDVTAAIKVLSEARVSNSTRSVNAGSSDRQSVVQSASRSSSPAKQSQICAKPFSTKPDEAREYPEAKSAKRHVPDEQSAQTPAKRAKLAATTSTPSSAKQDAQERHGDDKPPEGLADTIKCGSATKSSHTASSANQNQQSRKDEAIACKTLYFRLPLLASKAALEERLTEQRGFERLQLTPKPDCHLVLAYFRNVSDAVDAKSALWGCALSNVSGGLQPKFARLSSRNNDNATSNRDPSTPAAGPTTSAKAPTLATDSTTTDPSIRTAAVTKLPAAAGQPQEGPLLQPAAAAGSSSSTTAVKESVVQQPSAAGTTFSAPPASMAPTSSTPECVTRTAEAALVAAEPSSHQGWTAEFSRRAQVVEEATVKKRSMVDKEQARRAEKAICEKMYEQRNSGVPAKFNCPEDWMLELVRLNELVEACEKDRKASEQQEKEAKSKSESCVSEYIAWTKKTRQ